MNFHGSSSPLKEENIILNVKEIDHSWANSVSKELDKLPLKQMSGNKFSICRVPAHVRRGKEKYYDPAMVAIGPYHRGRPDLQGMEDYKQRYLKDFLLRNPKNSLQDYISILREEEKRAREHYFDHINLMSEDFVKMLLVDGCFIVEFFLKYHRRQEEEGIDIRNVKWFLGRIRDDLLLLENQIPFFVIDKLFKLLICDIRLKSQEERWTYDLGIAQIIAGEFFAEEEIKKVKIEDVDHLISLLYSVGMLQDEDENDNKKSNSFLTNAWQCIYGTTVTSKQMLHPMSDESIDHLSNKAKIPCASKLIEYGMKLKSKRTKFKSKNIFYKTGVLEIPHMNISEEQKCFMFNLLAFEQCNLTAKQELSSYFRFMDSLIDTPKDVEILEECGVIVSYLKSNEETALFYNELNDYGHNKDNDLLPVYIKINKFCDSKWHRYQAGLKRDYFSNPWTIISLIAAIILLFLTLAQTYIAWYQFANPSAPPPGS